jgi:hypothetical protein
VERFAFGIWADNSIDIDAWVAHICGMSVKCLSSHTSTCHMLADASCATKFVFGPSGHAGHEWFFFNMLAVTESFMGTNDLAHMHAESHRGV